MEGRHEIRVVTSFSIVLFAHWYLVPLRGHHLAVMVGSTLVPPALDTVSSLYAAMEIDGPVAAHVYPPQHEPAGAPGVRKATRGDAAPARSSAVTISSTTSKRDPISAKTRFASGSLLKKAAANLIHSARLSKPGAWRVGSPGL